MASTSRDAGDGSERGPDIGRCLRIGTRTERVLVIGEHGEIGDAGAPQRIDEPVEWAAALAFDNALVAAIHDRRVDRAPLSIGKGAVFDEIDITVIEIRLAKHGPDIRRAGLLAGAVGPVLDDTAEFDLKRARQLKTVVGLQQIGDAGETQGGIEYGIWGTWEKRTFRANSRRKQMA